MEQSTTATADIHRRRLLQVVGLGVAATSFSKPVLASTGVGRKARASLDREVVHVAAVQSHPGANVAANLESMLGAIDRIQSQSHKKDLIVFHASALHGQAPRTLADAKQVAIGMNSPIFAALGAKAQQRNVYASFSAFTSDADWPDAVIARQFLMGPDGKVALAAWQSTHNESAPFLTSVERVLDRYIDLYGRGAVLPVVNTNIGNIALASEQSAPEIYRALALKGADIVVRTSNDSPARWDVQACAAYNKCFTVAAASAATHLEANDEGASILRGSGSLIVGPNGEMLAEAGSQWAQTITATLPLAHARATRKTLDIHPSLVLPIYSEQAPLV